MPSALVRLAHGVAVLLCFNQLGRDVCAPFARALLGRLRVAKFCRVAVEMVTYAAFTWLTLASLLSEPWGLRPAAWYEAGQSIAPMHAACCVLYAARYIQAAVTLAYDPHGRDFAAMMLHHVLTAFVVLMSLRGHARLGLGVMCLFEPSDVLLHAAKLCKYYADARRSRAAALMADVLFVLFMLSFFVLRLGVLPYVWWTAESARPGERPPGTYVAWTLLAGIIALNLYWAGLILKVLKGLVARGHAADARSDDEDDQDDQDD